MGSGAILTEVIKAAQQLAAARHCRHGVQRDQLERTRARRRGAASSGAINGGAHASAFVAQQLQGSTGPIVAATDYVRAVPESIRAFLPEGRRYLTLGTDGFGRSDTRAALREFFSVDAQSIVKAALHLLKQK
jgi:pyruvate dehydrogenase E1 component